MNWILPRPLIALGLAAMLASAASADDKPNAEEQLQALIPEATSIHRTVYERIATSPGMPSRKSFKEFSLTAALMTISANLHGASETANGFRYLSESGVPKPAELASEMYHTIGADRFRVTTKPVTMIQSNRITDFRANIAGDKADGSFAFRVPKLYEGQARFTASKRENGWQFDSFSIPDAKIHVALDEEGHWQDVAESKADSVNNEAKPM